MVSCARISERRPEFNGGGYGPFCRFPGQKSVFRLQMLATRRGDVCAIPPAHQHAVLSLAQIGDAHGQPNSYGGQCHGKCEGGRIRQHAVAKIISAVPASLIAGQIIGLSHAIVLYGLPANVGLPARRRIQSARPEFEHPMLVVHNDRPLGFHRRSTRDVRGPILARPPRVSQTMSAGANVETRSWRPHGTCHRRLLLGRLARCRWQPSHHVELVIRAHGGDIGHSVR